MVWRGARYPAGAAFAAALGLVFAAGCGADDPAPEREAAQAEAPADDAGEAKEAGEAENSPPEIHALRFEPERPGTGETLRAVVEASDADGDSIFLDYDWTLDGEPVDSGVPKLVLTGARRGQPIRLVVTASDGKSESKPAELLSEVHNLPPKLIKLTIEPPAGVFVGVPISVRPEASDPDGDTVNFRYEWTVNGSLASDDQAKLDTADLSRGDIVQVKVYASRASGRVSGPSRVDRCALAPRELTKRGRYQT
jgi:hypothetical protein